MAGATFPSRRKTKNAATSNAYPMYGLSLVSSGPSFLEAL